MAERVRLAAYGVLPLERVREAMRAIADRSVQGRIVLKVR
jgi:hypothetical protein